MHLYPVATDGITRISDRDMVLGGVTIPAHTFVWFNMGAIHMSNHTWERPLEFLPVRSLGRDN